MFHIFTYLSNLKALLMNKSPCLWLLTLLILPGCSSVPGETGLRLELSKVNEYVYSAIGAADAPSYENAGHNNNLSFVITSDGVLVVNGGDNYLLAKALHNSIISVTDQPVRLVVNENGQGHAFLGNSYWSELGVPVIAHESAQLEIEKHGEAVLRTMQKRNREKAAGTFVAVPNQSFSRTKSLMMGDTRIELLSFGAAHSPGDISVWLPDHKIIIAGDIAFHERLLAIFPDTDVSEWIESFDRMVALEPKWVIPGHGHPTDIETVRKFTQGYLQFLTNEIERILDEDGDLAEAYAIDQTDYAHLNTFEELAVKNAGRLFQTMEMELFE